MEGCSNLAARVPWRKAGVPTSKGCGSAMRVAPIGLFYPDLDRVADVARCSSLLTHGHPAAVQGAAAAAILVTLALRGATPEEMFTEVDRRCATQCEEFASAWRKLPDVLSQPPEAVLIQGVQRVQGNTLPSPGQGSSADACGACCVSSAPSLPRAYPVSAQVNLESNGIDKAVQRMQSTSATIRVSD